MNSAKTSNSTLFKLINYNYVELSINHQNYITVIF